MSKIDLDAYFSHYDQMQREWENDDVSYDDRLRELQWLMDEIRGVVQEGQIDDFNLCFIRS